MTIITKGMGKIMKSKMRKAFVKKPTFPGPNTINILNREITKKRKKRGPGYRGSDIVEGPLKMRKDIKTGAQKPGKRAIEIGARINRQALRDYYKSLPHKRYPPPKGKK